MTSRAPTPSAALPPNPPKVASPPQTHLHPAYLFELRERLDSKSKVWALLKPAVKKVILDPAVHSVTYSKKMGPGGPNAFLSYAPHFHPNKASLQSYIRDHPGAQAEEWEDRIVWDRIDGNRNSDDGGATQGEQLNAVCDKVFLLALTYHFATKFIPDNAEQYAEKAYKLLWIFFGDPATAMLPETEYGQYIRGCQSKPRVRPEGLLHVRRLVQLSQVLPLLPPPPSPFSPFHFMHPWLERHVNFLQRHEIGESARQKRNNIGTHYYVQLCTHLVTLNRALEAHAIIISLFSPTLPTQRGLKHKIDPISGALKEEMKRPNPFHYTAFELEPLTFLADMTTNIRRYNGGTHLPDVWESENHLLKKAVDFGLEYFLRSLGESQGRKASAKLPSSVLKEPENGIDLRSLVFQTRSAAIRYGREEYAWVVGKGGDGEMEPLGKEKEHGQEWKSIEPLKAWNAAGRLRWALLEGY